QAQPAPYVAEAKVAVKRAIPLLQKSGQTWLDRVRCTSCHHQSMGFVALKVAKDNGFRIDEGALRKQLLESDKRRARYTDPMLELTGAINGVSGHGYQLLAQTALGTPASNYTDNAGFFLTAKQPAKGYWVSTSHRPPMEDSAFTVTATSIRALRAYPAGKEGEAAIARGRQWLVRTKPTNAEGRAMKLLGLVWSGASRFEIAKARQAILREQLPDGGWAQTTGRKSDAYATGQAMVALGAAGTSHRAKAITLGAKYLVSTQKPDGSWLVPTRRVVSGLPYFETGFPHGIDQFISYAGSAWATTALSAYASTGNLTALKSVSPQRRIDKPTLLAKNPKDHALLHAAWHGTATDVRNALAKGGSPNAKTTAGTTALMLAARDSAKVEALLSAGANPNGVSPNGATALSLASGTYGALPSMRLLLAAKANPNKGPNQETPLSHALQTHENERITLLLDAGAKLEPLSLLMAYSVADLDAMEIVLQRGFDVNTENPLYGGNAVNDAVVDRQLEILALVLRYGGNPNVIDKEGFSPLQVAALGDPENWKLVQLLLDAGSRRDHRTKTRPTALTLAKKAGNAESLKLLSGG
ncbi:MAG: ankyrin repeat domain-containing protein, partial [Fimbriimonas sp.]